MSADSEPDVPPDTPDQNPTDEHNAEDQGEQDWREIVGALAKDAKHEPTSGIRQLATTFKSLHQALLDAEFPPALAARMTAEAFAAVVSKIVNQ